MFIADSERTHRFAKLRLKSVYCIPKPIDSRILFGYCNI